MKEKPGWIDKVKQLYEAKVKPLLEAVDTIQKTAVIISWLFTAGLPFALLTSFKTNVILISGGVLGGFLGYIFTVHTWAGKGKEKCLKQRKKFFISFIFLSFLLAAILSIFNPYVAEIHPYLKSIRRTLINFMQLTNTLFFFNALFIVYSLTACITLSSRKLWEYNFPSKINGED